MSDVTRWELRIDRAFKELGFLPSAEQPPVVVETQARNAEVFIKEYERGAFRFMPSITPSEVARDGEEVVIARKIAGLKRAAGLK